ncbi:MAG: aminotransferase class V-fold PLP-dependent enzyme [Gemmatimonadales bacterium]
MTLSGRYFIPGPVEVAPAVMQAMLQPMIPHRGSEGHALVAALQPGLRALFRTERPVMLATGSATAMMEAAVRSGVRDRLLAVVNGTFGERFAFTAEQCGKEVIRLHVPRGVVLEPELLSRMLDGPPIDAVSLVHCETSTGALTPIELLLPILQRNAEIITIIDAVTSVGGSPVETDTWRPDFLLAGSQKAMGLPPGLAFAVASERFLARAAELDDRGFYLDVLALHRAAVESRFPQTPALPVVFALAAQLDRIRAEGLEARWARHRAMRERVEAWVASHGKCTFFAPAGRRADTVSALRLAPGRSARGIAGELAAAGWQVAYGLDEDEDQLIRIGHMGDLQPSQLDPLFDVLEPRL